MIVRIASGRVLATLAVAAVPLTALTILGPTQAGATTANKSPIKLMTIDSLSGPVQYTEIPIALKVAAKNVNQSGGIQGHPIQILACDDQASPNLAANCAREAVADKVLAVVGNVNGEGASIMPILAAAGIPEVACEPNSTPELTSPYSFPITAAALGYVSAGAIGKADSATSMAYVGPNVPAFVGLMTLTKALLPATGATFAGVTLTDLAATSYTQPVAQVYGSSAKGVYVSLPSASAIPSWTSAVESGGYTFQKTITIWNGFGFHPSDLNGPLKNKVNGTFVWDQGETPTDTSLPGIAAFHKQVQAAGVKNMEYDDPSLQAFVGVHVIANLLNKASGEVTKSATLISAMKDAGTIKFPGWVPFNWSKPALTGQLGAAFPRYFTAEGWLSKIVNNKEVTATQRPYYYTGPVKLSS